MAPEAAIKPAANCLFHFLNSLCDDGVSLLRHSMDVYFCTFADKDAFILCIRKRFTPPGEKPLSYHDLFLGIFDVVESEATFIY